MPPTMVPRVSGKIIPETICGEPTPDPAKGRWCCREHIHHMSPYLGLEGGDLVSQAGAMILPGTLLLTAPEVCPKTNPTSWQSRHEERPRKKAKKAQILITLVITLALFQAMICWRPPPSSPEPVARSCGCHQLVRLMQRNADQARCQGKLPIAITQIQFAGSFAPGGPALPRPPSAGSGNRFQSPTPYRTARMLANPNGRMNEPIQECPSEP